MSTEFDEKITFLDTFFVPANVHNLNFFPSSLSLGFTSTFMRVFLLPTPFLVTFLQFSFCSRIFCLLFSTCSFHYYRLHLMNLLVLWIPHCFLIYWIGNLIYFIICTVITLKVDVSIIFFSGFIWNISVLASNAN